MTLPDVQPPIAGTAGADVVDVLLRQHRQLRLLCLDIQAAGADKRRLFAELTRLVHRHELGERTAVHPVTRDRTGDRGQVVAEACAVQEERVDRLIGGLTELGVDHPAFDAQFAAFRLTLLDHAAYEEQEEFPRLRQHVAAQRLHLMASELINVQIMS